MTHSLDEYRAKLVIKILYADSAEAIERYIETAIHALTNRGVNGYIIARFIVKVMNQFEVINLSAPEDKRGNIIVAKKYLDKVIESVLSPAG